MVLKHDQERVKTLLRDTITLLCKNGLEFKTKFSIEAVIGVTLDDDDVFLMSINELIKSQSVKEQGSSAGEDSEGSINEEDLNSKHKRRKRKRSTGRANLKREDASGSDEQISLPPGRRNDHTTEQLDEHTRPPWTKSSTYMKTEAPSDGEDADDNQDIVFIKEEVDTWGGSLEPESDVAHYSKSFTASQSHDTNFPSFSDVTLVPVSSQEGSLMSHARVGSSLHRPHMTPVSSGAFGQQGDRPEGIEPNQTVELDSSVIGLKCPECPKSCGSKQSLQLHLDRHRGIFPYYCDVCNKGMSSLSHLRGHTSIHTGNKEFMCTICGKHFFYSSHLKRHERTIHKMKNKKWARDPNK